MPPTTTTDTESIRIGLVVMRCQVGDESAFTSLYTMFAEKTMRYLTTVLDRDLAEDVHQEVWTTVYQQVVGLANPAGFRTWLYRITRNRAVDALRRVGRRSELLGATTDNVDALLPDGEDAWDLADHSDGVAAALKKLSPAHREVLVLAFWEEMPYEEIALVAGCPVGTVRSRIHHAKQHLRRVLAGG